MKAMVLFLLLSCGLAQAAEYKLVWSEEFDTPGRPDSTRWDYEEGFVRNEELQYYTRDREQNSFVAEGCLVLTAIREEFANPAYDSTATDDWTKSRKSAQYTSASLITHNKAAWGYGRIEVRAKLPTGRGLWPAIWTLGENIDRVGYPACGEIDIMENVGFEPDMIYGTAHTPKSIRTHEVKNGDKIEIKAPYEDFHVYAIERDSAKIDFLVDGRKYFTFPNDGGGVDSWPFDNEQYLILNIAVGGAWGAAQGMDESVFPQRMYVDYVRVYQEQ